MEYHSWLEDGSRQPFPHRQWCRHLTTLSEVNSKPLLVVFANPFPFLLLSTLHTSQYSKSYTRLHF
jgi:hypothetical protein